MEQFANKSKSTLVSTINAVATTLQVTSAASFPTQPQFRLVVDDEIMLVTGVSGTTFTVTRGAEGSTAASHSAGVNVFHSITGGALDQLRTDALLSNSQLLPRFTSPDANTVLHWRLDESPGNTTGTWATSSSAYANSGTAGTLTQVVNAGTVQSVQGLFTRAAGFNGSSRLSSGNTTIGPTGTALTVSFWVKLRSFGSTYQTFVSKAYRNDNTFNPPYNTIAFYTDIVVALDGSWAFYLTTGAGVQSGIQLSGANRIRLNEWCHIAMTYDGSNVRAYFNGVLCGTQVATGNIDYGTNGPWDIGGVSSANAGQYVDGIIDDVRVENVVRSETYFTSMYRNGVGLFDNYTSNRHTITSTTTNITVSSNDDLIAVGAITGPITVTLPASPTIGQRHLITDTTGVAASFNITVSGNGANINGSSTFVMNVNYSSLTVCWTGSRWNII